MDHLHIVIACGVSYVMGSFAGWIFRGVSVTHLSRRLEEVRSAVRLNHEWHTAYDEYGGYPESELFEINLRNGYPTPELRRTLKKNELVIVDSSGRQL